MPLMNTAGPFTPAESADPAIPGDPFTRLRFFYGQLLGAADFTAEQRARVLRDRLHLSLLHGFGTIWGLRVSAGPQGEPEPRPEVVVAPGLAVDALGREIYVDRDQCLDVTALHAERLWGRLSDPGIAGESREVRRAYVVLSYLACLGDRAPGIAPPCADERDLHPFSRVYDRFRLDLVETPPDPGDLDVTRRWLEASGPRENGSGWPTVREALVDFVTNAGPDDLAPLSARWLQPTPALLLLATVDLVRESGGGADRTGVLAVDNRPRAILPPAQLVAEQVLGHRLAGPDGRTPLTLVSLETDEADGASAAGTFTLAFSRELAPLDDAPLRAAVTLRVLTGSVWSDALDAVAIAGDRITVRASAGALSEGTVFQLRVTGAGPDPVVGAGGEALAGWWSEGVRPEGGPRDLSVVRAWRPAA